MSKAFKCDKCGYYFDYNFNRIKIKTNSAFNMYIDTKDKIQTCYSYEELKIFEVCNNCLGEVLKILEIGDKK